jgi:hypothetical protein
LPDLWLAIIRHDLEEAVLMASIAAVRVPTWFTLIILEFAAPNSIPSCTLLLFDTKMSSLILWLFVQMNQGHPLQKDLLLFLLGSDRKVNNNNNNLIET